MSNNANRYGGHGDRGVKGRGKNGDRNTNNRDNKVNHVGNSEPKQKVRRHGSRPLRLLVGIPFQVLFHSPCRGAFHLSLTVLVRYRSLRST